MRFNNLTLVRFSVILMLTGALVLLLGSGYVMCIIGVLLNGLGCASINPCMVHEIPTLVDRRTSQAVTALQQAASSCGSMLMPLVTGFLFGRMGVALMPWWMLCFGAVLFKVEKRLIALELQAAGKKAKEISAITGFHPGYISQLKAKYRDGGIEAITGNHYGGNRRNMSFEEEANLLEPFRQRASQGQLVEVSKIKAVYEEAVGHTIGGSQIYYVLRRHGWRKVMPRSRHPKKASDEAIEASKKLTPKSSD